MLLTIVLLPTLAFALIACEQRFFLPAAPTDVPAPAAPVDVSTVVSPDGRYSFTVAPAVMRMTDTASQTVVATFDLGGAAIDPATMRFTADGSVLIASSAETNFFAFNLLSRTVTLRVVGMTEGMAAFSPDAGTLAVYHCERAGGRGQWCWEPEIVFLDTYSGNSRAGQFGGVQLDALELHFSQDSRLLTASGCFSYSNPYFGWCGDAGELTWEAATGALFEARITATSAGPYAVPQASPQPAQP
ncbi:MAG: hypothetical protein IPK19_28605 [Chloroflexi bacterium]|nr:hypothetical protein [Chloroflexota bacterium]